MGRPRKRRAAEEPVSDEGLDDTRPPVAPPSLDSSDDGANFLDLLPSFFGDDEHLPFFPLPELGLGPADDVFAGPSLGLDLSETDILQDISFGGTSFDTTSISKDINSSLQDYVTQQQHPPLAPSPPHVTPPLAAEETPTSVSSDRGSHDGDAQAPPPAYLKPLPCASCGCLSSLYLALESLNRLPSDVVSAMRVARSATKIAQDVLDCSQCSNAFFRDPLQPQPVQTLQNMMCLGALVPSACNAYAQIMELIDDETEAARRASRQIFFSFKDVGGLWGLVMDSQSPHSLLHEYDNKHLRPDVWRATVQTILKLDVYGLGGRNGASPPGGHLQRGLKDVVNHLDQTARLRHDMMDELIAKGKMPPLQSKYLFHQHRPIPPEQRNCVQVVESARQALDSLILK